MKHPLIARIAIVIILIGLIIAALTSAQTAKGTSIDVLTSRYDIARTGANLNETTLTTGNVNVNQFGKLFSRSVVGDIYGQPLYVSGLSIPGQGTHNVVFVVTMHNNVYAFDADDPAASTALWQVNLGVPFTNVYTGDIWEGEDGVLSTPVIDRATNTMYLVAHHDGVTGAQPPRDMPNHELHALDITTGAEKLGGPIIIQGSVPSVNGCGSSAGGTLTYDSNQHLQRPALLLLNGYVYIGFGGINDRYPWHGWLLSYQASNLTQKGIISTSPNQCGSAIWMSGSGPASDGTSIYVATGNGQFDASTGGPDYGDSVIKLNTTNGNLSVADWFTPSNQCYLDAHDLDLGVTGPLVIPNSTLVLGGSKQGKLHLLNRSSMGHFSANGGVDGCMSQSDPGDNPQIVQWFQAASGHMHSTPTYWNGPNGPIIYVWTENDYLKGFKLVNGLLNTIPFTTSQSPVVTAGMPSGIVSLSANGGAAGSGIVWGTQVITNHEYTDHQGVIRALDANDLTHELWNSQMNAARDGLGVIGKFNPPMVANGKVYVGSFSNALQVYGLLPLPPTPTPTASATINPLPNDTVGVFRRSNGTFYLRNSNSAGPADITVAHGDSNSYPVAGDWDGDGFDTVGIYNQQNGVFTLYDSNAQNALLTQQFVFGNPGDIPIAGRWTAANPHDGVGVFRPSNGIIYLLINFPPLNGVVTADYSLVLGNPGDIGLGGRWKPGGTLDAPGVYRPPAQKFYVTYNICPQIHCVERADASAVFGNAGDYPFKGDWTGLGTDGIGVFRPSNGMMYLRNTVTTGVADIKFAFGNPNDIPISGHWKQPGSIPHPISTLPGVIVPGTAAPIVTPSPSPTATGSSGQFD